jgi:hypothetical protein
LYHAVKDFSPVRHLTSQENSSLCGKQTDTRIRRLVDWSSTLSPNLWHHIQFLN